MNKELFTVKISRCAAMSISQYVDCNGQDVLILKWVGYKADALYAFIKHEESWVEIKSGSNQKLDEQANFVQKEA